MKKPPETWRVHMVVATLSILRGCGGHVVSEDCVQFGDRLAKLVDAGVTCGRTVNGGDLTEPSRRVRRLVVLNHPAFGGVRL